MITWKSWCDLYKSPFSYHQLWRLYNFQSDFMAINSDGCELNCFCSKAYLQERGQFCTKCMHSTSFKYREIALEQRDAICFAAQYSLLVLCEKHSYSFFLSYLQRNSLVKSGPACAICRTRTIGRGRRSVWGAIQRGAPGALLQASVGEHHCVLCVCVCVTACLLQLLRWAELLIYK